MTDLRNKIIFILANKANGIMREIKFRGWDKKNQRMRRIDYLGIGKSGYFCVCENQNEFDGNMDVMQFTGLLGKNNKEIYEGDIVKFKGVGKIIYIGEVFLNDKKLHYTIRGDNCCTAMMPETKYQIIGNTYENPELSRDKKNL